MPFSREQESAHTKEPGAWLRNKAGDSAGVHTSPASARKGGRGADSTSPGLMQEDRDLDTRACSTGEGSSSQLQPDHLRGGGPEE